MHSDPVWSDIALRLVLAALAGAAFGIDRGVKGRAAGLRTTMLVCLAAALAMLLADILTTSARRPDHSVITMDVMRMPLGILTGVGFIGGGAILRQGGTVTGVTTAATLWFVTVAGLCFGAGTIGLGVAGVLLGLAVVWALKWAEGRLHQIHTGTLLLAGDSAAMRDLGMEARLAALGYETVRQAVAYRDGGRACTRRYQLRWRGRYSSRRHVPPFLEELATLPGMREVRWSP
ncbi:MgtC/SapB family protein [Roseomonas gilardii subsp. gilardii]|uniref:MgtC/SapB family protein n=1 Tax=Roseomonas gilardii TaxID=257708 RepID=UPI001FFA77D5|nr:MgtC/SapB family protein [Roseomonas gilardii]UPG71250.1 MgtC/SapB family protein [Roseomonas gilardii subsp. gilardii]